MISCILLKLLNRSLILGATIMNLLLKTSSSSLCLLAFALFFGLAHAERVEDICRLFANNTIIRDPESCSKSITCIDSVSHYKECTGSTPFFDKATQKCVRTITDNTHCEVSCENKIGSFIADPKSCYGYYYCNDDGPIHGVCPEQSHFNETRQVCTERTESKCTASVFEYCSIIKDGIKFNDERRCDAYFSCSKGKLSNSKCKKEYFDPVTATCVAKSKVQCNEHPLPDNACGTARSPKKDEFISDEATCAGYFFCAKQADGTPDKNPRWDKCPQNTFFDKKTKSCVDPLLVDCAWDRCDGRTLNFVSSGTKGCRNYLICSDGVTVEEQSCGNMFFNEKKGICSSEIMYFSACYK